MDSPARETRALPSPAVRRLYNPDLATLTMITLLRRALAGVEKNA